MESDDSNLDLASGSLLSGMSVPSENKISTSAAESNPEISPSEDNDAAMQDENSCSKEPADIVYDPSNPDAVTMSEPQPCSSNDDGGKRKSPEGGDDREPKSARRSASQEEREIQSTSEGAAGAAVPSTNDLRIIDNAESFVERIDLGRVLKNMNKRSYRRNRPAGSSSDSDDDGPATGYMSPWRRDPLLGMDHRDVVGVDLGSSSDGSDSSDSIRTKISKEKTKLEALPTPDVLLKPKPKHNWFEVPEIVSRQLGYSNRCQGPKLFEERMHGSLHAVQRLELMYKLEKHSGCVNSLNFNSSGSLLASCSDDLTVCLWNWPIGKPLSSVQTGHKSNVFQAKFLPLQGHLFLATCSRDGQVRILELNSDGSLFARRQAGQHNRACHKLALIKDSPHCFLSCGEDAIVLNVDIRQNRASKVLTVTVDGSNVPLYSISNHPLDSNEFMVGGKNRYIRLYDRRNTSKPTLTACPNHLKAADYRHHTYVTSAVYNYNGSEILVSYNDEDIYLWDRRDSVPDLVHKYQGHRNNATIKGVNFFGPKSQFVVSGSDCGNIYFWEKETESIVQFMAGDENGIVNCLEPHPSIPVIATSGLDDDVKIWVPSNEQEPTLAELKTSVVINHRDREEERSRSADNDLDGQMLWLLWRHISHATRERPPRTQEEMRPSGGYISASPPSSNADDEEEQEPSAVFTESGCSPS